MGWDQIKTHQFIFVLSYLVGFQKCEVKLYRLFKIREYLR